MNCKPGDMAMVIKDVVAPVIGGDFSGDFIGEFARAHTSGRVVRLVSSFECERLGLCWNLEECMYIDVTGCGWKARGCMDQMPDDCLRPLPPLSDDEHDQAEAGKPERVAA